jgi:hypothetical protein
MAPCWNRGGWGEAMDVGLIDVDGHRRILRGSSKIQFPNLPLMKLSTYHKSHGDSVKFYEPLTDRPDIVYMSKVFDFTPDYEYPVNAEQIISGGTGYSLTGDLPPEVEHVYPDYGLYNITDTAYGFLTRGCPRGCPFCIVSAKEGRRSQKVADLPEFRRGQRNIKLLDPNLLACPDKYELLEQLADSGAWIDFTQGLDIRLMDGKSVEILRRVKVKMIHFAWDGARDEAAIMAGLLDFKRSTTLDTRRLRVYVLVNFDTTFEYDLYRIYKLRDMGYDPYVMVYDKEHAARQYRRLQRWVNNKYIFHADHESRFEDYRAAGIVGNDKPRTA